MPNPPILDEAALKPTNAKTLGKSPSYQAQLSKINPELGVEGVKFQVKKPGMFVRMRRLLGYDRDISDILGEFISSAISAAALNTDEVERAPTVFLVKGSDDYPVKIASRYINYGKEGIASTEIDNLLDQAKGKVKTKGKHATIVINETGAEKTSELVAGKKYAGKDTTKSETVIDKKELYRAIKISILLGDHDLNPGNFFSIKNEATGVNYVGRIDLGHAFNNLIKTWGLGADSRSRIAPDRGFVLDSLNRTEINGLKDSTPKLRKYYKGIIPDLDFADVLRESFDMGSIQAAIDAAKEQILEMMQDPKCAKEITKALITLGIKVRAPISPKIIADLKRGGDAAREALVNECLDNISAFVERNQEEQVSIGNVIEVQALIDKALTGKDVNLSQIAARITELYNTDKGYLSGKDKETGEVEWLRTDKDKTIFKGSLRDYIKHRATQLGVAPDKTKQYSNHLLVGEQVPQTESHQYGVDVLRDIITAQVVNSHIRSTPNADELNVVNTLVSLVRHKIVDYRVSFTPEQLKAIVKIAVEDYKKSSKEMGGNFSIENYIISTRSSEEIEKITEFNSVWKTIKSAFAVNPDDHIKLRKHYKILHENHNKAHPDKQLNLDDHQAKIKSFINDFRKTQGGKQKTPSDLLFSNEFVTAINLHVNDPDNSAKLLAGLKGEKPYNPAELCKAYVTCMQNVQEIRSSFPEEGRANDHIDRYLFEVSSARVNRGLSGKLIDRQLLDNLRDKMIPGSPFVASQETHKNMTDNQFAKNFGEHFPALKNILEKVVIDLNQEKYVHCKDKQKYLDHQVRKMVNEFSRKMQKNAKGQKINSHHEFSGIEAKCAMSLANGGKGLKEILEPILKELVPVKKAQVNLDTIIPQVTNEDYYLKYIKANCPRLYNKIDKELEGIKDPLKYSEYVAAIGANIIAVVGGDDGLMQIESIIKLSDELGANIKLPFDGKMFDLQKGEINPQFVNEALGYSVYLVDKMTQKYPNVINAITREHREDVIFVDSEGQAQFNYKGYLEHINKIRSRIEQYDVADVANFSFLNKLLETPLEGSTKKPNDISAALVEHEMQLNSMKDIAKQASRLG